MNKLALQLDGMRCGGCVKKVRQTLDGLSGVEVEAVAVGSAVIGHDPAVVTKDIVLAALAKAGFPAREIGPEAVTSGAPKGDHCGVVS